MSIYTVNGSPVKYDNKWLAPGGTHDLPPYNSTDAGKALVVNNEGDDVEWKNVGSSGTVDQTYDSTSSNAQSGTAVAEAISTKQDTISDLSDIRSGAEAGATAVQPSSLATVATTGDYDDLLNKPSIPAAQVNSDWNAVSGVSQILNKPNLATVATSGDYSDLTNKPTIPAAQVNSDWNAVSGVSQILNKPNLATVATSGDYSDLTNKPTIPSYTQGNMISLTNNQIAVSTTAGIIDIQYVNALPANPVANVLYLIPAV